MRLIVMIFIIVGVMSAIPKNAKAMSGNQLLNFCEGLNDRSHPKYASTETGLCAGYIGGVVDGYQSAFDSKSNRTFCRPVQVTNGQIQMIAIKYLKNNPQRLHDYAPFLILMAMSEAFPCKGGN